MTEKKENINWQERWKAEYDMGAKYYDIYEKLITCALEYGSQAMMKKETYLRPYAITLIQLYKLTRAAGMFETRKEHFQKSIKNIRKNLEEWENMKAESEDEIPFPIELLRQLEKLDEDLIETMQLMGLGIRVHKDKPWNKRFEEAFVGTTKKKKK